MRITFLALALAACRPTTVSNDACGNNAGSGTITTLSLGPDAADGSEPPFTAWNDGDTVKVVVGGQGSTMIVARLSAIGPSVPGCIPVEIKVSDGSNGTPIETLHDNLNVYGDSPRLTRAIFLPGLYPTSGQPIHVNASSLGASTVVTLVVER